MTDPSSVLKQGDVLRLEVSPQYATIRVIPNGNEGRDANFPRNLHNAAELFLKLGMVPQAVKLKGCVDDLLLRYSATPDGKSGVRLGRGCVCWECGYVGIPKDYVEGQAKAGPCANCGGNAQINWVSISRQQQQQQQNQNGGSSGSDDLPWIEESAMTEEQAKELKAKKEKELAEKRAAVEARVAQALAEREKKAEAAAT